MADDGFRDTWQCYWSAVNLLQFLPAFLPASRSGIEERRYAPIIEHSKPFDLPTDN